MKERSIGKVIFSYLIHSAFVKIIEMNANDLEIHFVYTGDNYDVLGLNSIFEKAMKIYKIKSIIVTMINLERETVIRKEFMDHYCNEKDPEKFSVNDDLESLFQDLRAGKQPERMVRTYYFPKLTKKELQLLEIEDEDNSEKLIYTQTFAWGFNWGPDLGETALGNDALNWTQLLINESILTTSEMPEPKSKFVAAFGSRQTNTIDNSFIP